MFSEALPHLPLYFSPEVLVVKKRFDGHHAAPGKRRAELQQLEHAALGQNLRKQPFQWFQAFQLFKTLRTTNRFHEPNETRRF